MSSASEVGIASAALVWLGRNEIASFDEVDDTSARLLKSRYPQIRDAVLRSYPWNFAMNFASLPGRALDQPMFGFSHRCTLPAGGTLPYCLRVWRVETQGSWTVRGRDLYTSRQPPVSIAYVGRETNPEVYDALFVEMVALELALRLANRLAGDDVRKRTRDMQSERKALRRAATLQDAMEASPDQNHLRPPSWIGARRPM